MSLQPELMLSPQNVVTELYGCRGGERLGASYASSKQLSAAGRSSRGQEKRGDTLLSKGGGMTGDTAFCMSNFPKMRVSHVLRKKGFSFLKHNPHPGGFQHVGANLPTHPLPSARTLGPALSG